MYKSMELNGKQLVTQTFREYLVTPIVVLFNKRLAEDFGIEDLSDGKRGKWTIDRMKVFCRLGSIWTATARWIKTIFTGYPLTLPSATRSMQRQA